MKADLLSIIFGMKVRQARLEANLTLTEFAAQSELSPSYVTEIEKGRKHPRADKIMKMAGVLGKEYDELVSIQLAPSLTYLERALNSPLLQQFPFDEFGLEFGDLVNLLTRAPDQMSALLHAIGEIGQRYDMKEEHLLLAVLRSLQELKENYFPELETAAQTFAAERGLTDAMPLTEAVLAEIIQNEFDYALDHTLIPASPDLRRYRSIFISGRKPKLLINAELMGCQQKFLLAREIGYHYLGLKERSQMSSPDQVDSFRQVFNDFKASYFAGALIMPQAPMLADVQALFDQSTWQPDRLLAMMDRYDVTPEMLMHRFSELIPQFFGLRLHFLRFHQVGQSYRLMKQLNMNRLQLPSGSGLYEHHCRRWLTVRILKELAQTAPGTGRPHAGAQLSEFLGTGTRYLCLGLARPLSLRPDGASSVIVGFRVDNDLRRTIRFLDDPAIPRALIHETCERCPLSGDQCTERAVPPTIWAAETARDAGRKALQDLLAREQA